MPLYFDINDLSSAIHAVCRIDPVRAKEGAVGRILGQLRGLELVSPAAFPGALLGLFAFWLGHVGKRLKVLFDGKPTKRTGCRSQVKTEKHGFAMSLASLIRIR